jgi:hypothetical protein
VAGVQRCGTTYLARLLDDHPEIEMLKPLRPERKLFLGVDHPRSASAFVDAVMPTSRRTAVVGEKATSYLDSDLALDRIHRALPDARVVVMLRDPVDRAVSHYRFSCDNGLETLPPLAALGDPTQQDRSFDRSRISVSPFHYLRRGAYVERLERLFAVVPAEQVTVVLLEELRSDVAALADLYDRLGVDRSHRPERFGDAENRSVTDIGDLPTEVEQRLTEELAEPNRRLEALLGRTLPWRCP